MDELEPLSESMKQLLDAERVVPKVSAAAKARMFAKLSGELFGPGGGGGTNGGQQGHPPAAPAAPAASAASAAAHWGTAAVTKLAVGVGLASFAVGGAVGVGVHAALQTPPPPTPPPVTAAPPAEPIPAAKLEEPPPAAAPQEQQAAPAPPPVVKAPAAKPDTLGAERSLVDQARSALARKDYASALGALDEHEKRFAHGQLTEERSALKVVALSGAGRADDAHAAAKAFKAKYPDSLLMPLVDSTP
jgi:hypothetical protein